MNEVLAAWNAGSEEDAVSELLPCCVSRVWARRVVSGRPYADEAALFEAADAVWWAAGVEDWLEAFACHPRIGQRVTEREENDSAVSDVSAVWSRDEQSHAQGANDLVQRSLAEGNSKYEQQFGFTYIVCATGKSAEEMLAILNQRLGNDAATEIREATEQQRQIMQIRLRKWVGSSSGGKR